MIKIIPLKIIIWVIFTIFFLCQLWCRYGTKENIKSHIENTPLIDSPQINPIDPSNRETILALATGPTYYLDANAIDDSGNGSSDFPWKTLAKSQTSCPEGSIIILRNGNYGTFNDNSYSTSRTNWTIYINEEGAIPVITSISCISNQDYNLRLIFYGIKIAPAWVNPGPSTPHNKSASPIYLWGCNYVSIYNCEITGTNKYLTPEAAYLREVDYIHIERCHIHNVAEGIVYIYSSNITMAYNYIHEVCACFFKDGWTGNSYIKIEGNHAHNAGYNTSDQYGEDATYHGSMIAIGNANTIVRNNFLHNGGGTGGIFFYEDGNPVYTNVLIENNVVYNTTNTTAVCLNLIANNVIIRNNIFIGQKRNENFGEYMYNNAFYVNSYAGGYNGSGLHIYNNIFIGRADFGVSVVNAEIDNNIIYSGSDFSSTHSIIALSIPDSDYFESGFFNGPLDLEYVSTPDQVLDLTFAVGSEGINFGDPNNQPSDCLGTLDANSEFIIPATITRDANNHSAGCYEVTNK